MSVGWLISYLVLISIAAIVFLSTTPILFDVLLYSLAVVLAGLIAIAAVRRLHDTGRSGWVCLVYLIPLIGEFLFLYLLFAPGKSIGNRWPRLER